MTDWMLQEEMEAEFNARYDDHRERYAATLADLEAFARSEEEAMEAEHEAWMATPEGQAWAAGVAADVAAREAVEAARADEDDLPF